MNCMYVRALALQTSHTAVVILRFAGGFLREQEGFCPPQSSLNNRCTCQNLDDGQRGIVHQMLWQLTALKNAHLPECVVNEASWLVNYARSTSDAI